MLMANAHAATITAYSCEKDTSDFDFMNVGCFEDRKVTPINISEAELSPEEYLKQDMQVCECLRTRPLTKDMMDNLPIDSSAVPLARDKEANVFLRNVTRNIEEGMDRLRIKNDAILFQTHHLDTNVHRIYNVMIKADTKKHDQMLTDLMSTIHRGSQAELGRKLDSNENGVIMSSLKNSARNFGKMDKILTEEEIQGESCLSMQGFLSYNLVPSEKEFWEDISKMSSFNTDDWNYEKLKNEMYQTQRAIKNAQGMEQEKLARSIRALRARLVFLNKNPLFKYGFNAKENGSLKNELFGIIKSNMSPDKACLSKDEACRVLYNKSEKRKQFEEKSAAIFKRPEVTELVQKQVDEDNAREIANITNKKNWKDNSVFLTQDILTQTVKDKTQFDITKCTRSREFTSEAESVELLNGCVVSFNLYCKMLDESKDKISDNAIPDFEKEWINEINPDPKENQLYQKKSDLICNGFYQSKSNPQEVKNFEQFKSSFCKNKSNAETCSSKQELFKEFLTQYPMQLEFDEFSNVKATTVNPETIWNTHRKNKILSREQVAQMEKDVATVGKSGGGAARALADLLFTQDRENLASAAPEEPGLFSSIMKDISSSINEVSEVSNQNEAEYAKLPFTTGTEKTQASVSKKALEDAQKSKEEIDREKELMEEELEESRRKLSKVTEDASRSSLENRVKLLEQMLAQKDKMSENYEKLIDKLTKEQERPTNARETTTIAKSPDNHLQGISRSIVNNKNEVNENYESIIRAPASVGDGSFSTAGMRSGMGQNSALNNNRRKSVTSSKVNEALLSKYGVNVQGSGEGTILVASDKESQNLPILTNSTDAKNLPLDVSRSQYEKFKINDLDTLRDIYDSRIKGIDGSVVKILVRTQGEKDPLEFYAIKEGDKVIFQPVRKARLNDLKLTLPST